MDNYDGARLHKANFTPLVLATTGAVYSFDCTHHTAIFISCTSRHEGSPRQSRSAVCVPMAARTKKGRGGAKLSIFVSRYFGLVSPLISGTNLLAVVDRLQSTAYKARERDRSSRQRAESTVRLLNNSA